MKLILLLAALVGFGGCMVIAAQGLVHPGDRVTYNGAQYTVIAITTPYGSGMKEGSDDDILTIVDSTGRNFAVKAKAVTKP